MSRQLAIWLFLVGISACALTGTAFGWKIRTYRGAYNNAAYGYRVTIPKGLVGYDDGNPDYQRGFIIDLKRPSSKLYVYGEVNSLEYKNPCQALADDLQYTRNHARGHVQFSKSKEVMLGPMRACERQMRYIPRNTSEEYAKIVLHALGKDGYFLTIKWTGPTRSLVKARHLINQLRSTWGYAYNP